MTTEPKNENVTEEAVIVDGEPTPTAVDVFIEHQKNAVTSTREALMSLIPGGVKEHGQRAVKESLEGYRVLFNSVIDELVERIDNGVNSLREAKIEEPVDGEETSEPVVEKVVAATKKRTTRNDKKDVEPTPEA